MTKINEKVLDVALERLDFPFVLLGDVISTIKSFNGFSYSEKHKESIMKAILKEDEDWALNFHETMILIEDKYKEGLEIYTINTMCIKIYGRCDDLLEFESNNGWSEEFMVNSDRLREQIGLKDGTIFFVEYDAEGIWRINLIKKGTKFYKLIKNEERLTNEDDPYSDILILKDFEENPIVSGL